MKIALESLNLYATNVPNLEGIIELTNLKELIIGGNETTRTPDLDGLANSSLLDLVIYTERELDLEVLSELPNLTRLMISGMVEEVDIDFKNSLNNNTNLTHVKLLHVNEVTNVKWNTLDNLTMLFIHGNDFDSLQTLSNSNLLQLGLSSINPLDFNPFDKITGLNHLDTLEVSNLGIESLSNITSYRNLTNLYLPNNRLTKLDGISNLNNLQFLDISSNPIDNMDWATGLDSLTTVVTIDTNIPKDTAIEGISILYE